VCSSDLTNKTPKKIGKGKTTLLNLLAKELKAKTGTVSHHDQLQMAYFGQTNIQRLTAENTVEKEILDCKVRNEAGAIKEWVRSWQQK